ncbi:potential TrimethylGuanosine Synthase [Pseudozyma hubeiensis SY62]|uniref:Trimethylguanosine synthase n=1 Tax=Pseudozyma hubeiensis (strain SY62) TaxID=1305764 RepID=R9PLQ3_PSEHS|nr:potential TrimethylGuanosine Synthase [Pseudozyma hubeiensis SY62]GAC99045.1 potential TrimethylGuanosine Synthase [Pseudozyma hubeiensis SY62]
MPKKRKRTSLGAYVQHLSPATSTTTTTTNLNLSAYHPDLDLSFFPTSSQSLYHSLLPHALVHPSTFPASHLKYWRHRHSLLSLYSSGCLLDEQSWYSITPESVAFRIAKRCSTDRTVVDLFAGAGGNAIQFAFTCAKVIAVELDEVKLKLARWNAMVYGVEDRIVFVQGDSLGLLKAMVQRREKGGGGDEVVWKGLTASQLDDVQAVFLSPPWGGVDYAAQPTTPSLEQSNYHLSSIQPIDGLSLFAQVTQAFHTNNIAFYLPRNTSLSELSHLTTLLDPARSSSSSSSTSSNTKMDVKIEYQYVNNGKKLSSLTAYYGDLASDWDDDTDDWRKT